MKITYVTGNWAKVESAKQFFEPLGFEIDNIKIDTEIKIAIIIFLFINNHLYLYFKQSYI